MPMIETVDELADAIATMMGVYGMKEDDGTDNHDHDCRCRICFVSEMAMRIRLAAAGVVIIQSAPRRWWGFWKASLSTDELADRVLELIEGRHTMNRDEHRAYHREIDESVGQHTQRNPDTMRRQSQDVIGEPDRNEATDGQLTPHEKTLIDTVAMVWKGFKALDHHWASDDKHDARHHLDAIQNVILARASARANPDLIRQ